MQFLYAVHKPTSQNAISDCNIGLTNDGLRLCNVIVLGFFLRFKTTTNIGVKNQFIYFPYGDFKFDNIKLTHQTNIILDWCGLLVCLVTRVFFGEVTRDVARDWGLAVQDT